MSARNAKRKAQPQVVVVPATTGKPGINATRTDESVTLELPSGFSIVVQNGPRREPRNGIEFITISCTPGAHGKVEGWAVQKKGVTAGDDCSVAIRAGKASSKQCLKKPEGRA